MSSAYGESVKFYERMSDLHGQLKTYDEKQYNLQDELERLLKLPRPASSEVDLHESPPEVSRFHLSQNGKSDDVTEEERRRQRNQIILEKIKQLESNASVFAARSEKLRMMRREYETIVKKYMSSRKTSSLLFDSKQNLQTPKIIDNFSSPKLFTSTGVNTIITGPIKPLDEPETLPSSCLEVERNLSFTNVRSREIISFGQSDIQYQLPDLQQDNNTQELDHFKQGIGRLRETMPVHLPTSTHNQNLNESKYNHNQNLNEIKPRNLLGEKDGDRDEEESLNEKLRHNPYFDLSTTSESELTSAKNAIKKKMLPININLDDTTQSDTFSLSMHVPTKLSSKSKLDMSTHLLNLSLTSDATESSLQQKPQITRTNSELTKLINEEGDMEKPQLIQPTLGENATINRRSSLSLRRSSNDNDNELELLTDSDSSTTSPGDSVMDSVQNRTLNESVAQDRQDDENKETIKPSPLVNSNNSAGTNTIQKEMDVFLVSDTVKLINESVNKNDENVKIESSPFSRPENISSTKALSATANLTESNRLEFEAEISKERNPMNFKVPSNSADILNNFAKIEDEFAIGNESLDETETWERNTISLDDKEDAVEVTKEQKNNQNPVKLTSVQETPQQLKDSTEKKPDDNLGSSRSVQSSKTAPASKSGTSRRVRLKFDYEDSDSEGSEAVKGKPKKNEGAEQSGSQGNQKDIPQEAVDDDFDDFFDI